VPKNNVVKELSRDIPVIDTFDVVVVGGGMAGVSAAVAATRNAARVCLIERYCGLGGLATLGNVTAWLPLCDGKGRQVIAGLGEELLKLSVADLKENYPAARFRGLPDCWKPGGDREERIRKRYRVDFNPAAYMLALEKLVVDSGVKLFYDTRFCSVSRKDGHISHVIVENKSGRSAIACRTVVDATGDADVCVSSGEQTLSVESNVIAGWFYTLAEGELKLHQLSNQYNPSAGTENAQGPFFSGDDADQVTAHILKTREVIRERLVELRANQQTSNVQLIMPATMACLRMTRRLRGGFTLAQNHMHHWFEDTIGLTGDWSRPGPVYAIPIRCMSGTMNDNLLVAGRCISVENNIWDALRAIPPCVVTGEAAGTAAALAVHHTNGDIHALEYEKLRDRLLEQGVLLDPELVTPHHEDMIEIDG
jgi:hypothetical protein